MALPVAIDEATIADVEAFDGGRCVPLIVYWALATILRRTVYGPIAIACSVVVESIVTGPVYRVDDVVGVHPSVV